MHFILSNHIPIKIFNCNHTFKFSFQSPRAELLCPLRLNYQGQKRAMDFGLKYIEQRANMRFKSADLNEEYSPAPLIYAY